MSDTRSTFLDSSIVLFRLSRTVFSVLLSYFAAKLAAANSSSGTPSCRSCACESRDGRRALRFEIWEDELMIALCDRFESAWRFRRCDCTAWMRDAGSVDARLERESVLSLFR